MHAVVQLEAVDRRALAGDAYDRLAEHGNVERVELLTVLGQIESGRLAVGADDDVARPGCEVERHANGAPAASDHHDLLAARIVAVAVWADVRVVAEGVLESRHFRPDVANADGEE